RTKPDFIELRVETGPQHQLHRWSTVAAMAIDEGGNFTADNGLYISVASEGLSHAGGIHIELNFRLPPRQQVALKMGGNIQGKGVEASIHAGIHLVLADQHRRREIGWVEGIDNTHRQGRAILDD